jgi:hypothetical protein
MHHLSTIEVMNRPKLWVVLREVGTREGRLSHTSRRNTSHDWPMLCALLFVVAFSRPVLAQSTKVDPRLVGTWHSVENRCAADEECSNTVNDARLNIGKTGSFKWVQFRDLEKSDVCTWRVSSDSPGTLDFEDCDVDPDGNIDRFVYRLSSNTLTLTGIQVNPKPHEVITMRFERGPLVSESREWNEPLPETCNTAPLPQWAKSASQIASDGDLHGPNADTSNSQRLIADRNRLLWRAVRAHRGNAPPIALKAISYSIEGDVYEEYLFASRGHVEIVEHTDEGLIEHLKTCSRKEPIVKLKRQDSSKLWRFATSAPSSTSPAYIVYPGDGTSSHIFPRP